MRLTAKMVEHALSDDADPWRIGNQVLYDLCSRYPMHKHPAEIVAKVWLIGRSYSASVERKLVLSYPMTNFTLRQSHAFFIVLNSILNLMV